MGQDLLYHRRVFDRCDDPHFACADVAGLDVDIEDALE